MARTFTPLWTVSVDGWDTYESDTEEAARSVYEDYKVHMPDCLVELKKEGEVVGA